MDHSSRGVQSLFFVFIGLAVLCAALLCLNWSGPVKGAASRAAGGRVKFKVALLLPGQKTDLSWSQACYAGLERIKSELDAEVAFSEDVQPADAYILLSKYAAAGFDLVIAAGSEYSNASYTAAASFPRTSFMMVGPSGGNNDNLGSVSLRDCEMIFLAGSLAAEKSRSGKVALMSARLQDESFPDKENGVFFVFGAKNAKRAVIASSISTAGITEPKELRRLAERLIAEGNDVLAVDVGPLGEVVHALAREKGVKSIGWIMDQKSLAPEAVLGNCIQRYDEIILAGARLARLGRWEGKKYKFGLLEDAQYLLPSPGLLSKHEEDTLEALREDIISSKLKLYSLN